MVGSDDPFLLGSLPIFRGEQLNFGRGYLYFVDFFYGKNVGKYTITSHWIFMGLRLEYHDLMSLFEFLDNGLLVSVRFGVGMDLG